MQVHLVSDGEQSGRSSPWLLSIFGVSPHGPHSIFLPPSPVVRNPDFRLSSERFLQDP
jgi:hypothetical protein